jgi:hypothetical protein
MEALDRDLGFCHERIEDRRVILEHILAKRLDMEPNRRCDVFQRLVEAIALTDDHTLQAERIGHKPIRVAFDHDFDMEFWMILVHTSPVPLPVAIVTFDVPADNNTMPLGASILIRFPQSLMQVGRHYRPRPPRPRQHAPDGRLELVGSQAGEVASRPPWPGVYGTGGCGGWCRGLTSGYPVMIASRFAGCQNGVRIAANLE